MSDSRLALVTGASRGIGKAIAENLGKAGFTLAGTATSQAGADKITQAFVDAGVNGKGFVVDVSNGESIEALIKGIKEEFGSTPEVLVNNAGITRDNLLMRMKEEDWDSILNTNLTSVFRLSKACMRGMMKARWGRIINISSTHGIVASNFKSGYVSSKHGLVGLTKVVALETAKENITCNAIGPGFVDTELVRKQIRKKATQQKISLKKAKDILLAKHATNNFVKKDDVSSLVYYLTTNEASQITGSNLIIDGGWTSQ